MCLCNLKDSLIYICSSLSWLSSYSTARVHEDKIHLKGLGDLGGQTSMKIRLSPQTSRMYGVCSSISLLQTCRDTLFSFNCPVNEQRTALQQRSHSCQTLVVLTSRYFSL